MCPTAISMNTYVLRIHILTDIVNLCGKSVLTRHPDTGLARLPQCQSGLWRSPSPADGVYTSLGAFKGVYSGSNTTGKQIKIYALGGNPPLKKSTLVTLITASIRFHLWPVSADIRLLIPLMETHNGINLAVFHLMFLTVRHFLLYQME